MKRVIYNPEGIVEGEKNGPPKPRKNFGQRPEVVRGKVGSAVRKQEAASPAGLQARIDRLQVKLESRPQGPARDQLRRRIASLKKRSGG